jgi:hypothetical protein
MFISFRSTANMSCKQDCTFALPSSVNVRFGLRILDRMRNTDRAMSLQELIQLVITSRVKCNAKLEPLPFSWIIPLAAESFWRYILSLTDRRSQTGQLTLRRLSLKSRECVVHLLEYLELLYQGVTRSMLAHTTKMSRNLGPLLHCRIAPKMANYIVGIALKEPSIRAHF